MRDATDTGRMFLERPENVVQNENVYGKLPSQKIKILIESWEV